MFVHKLTELGLNSTEASVYLACIELSKSKARDIAQKAGVKRESAYAVLKNLVNKKLVREFGKGNDVKRFSAENPKKLLDQLEERLTKDNELLKLAHVTIAELNALFQRKNNLRATLFDGEEANELLSKDIFASGDKVREIYHFDRSMEAFPLKENDIRLKFQTYRPRVVNITTSNKIHGIKKDRCITRFFLPSEKYEIYGELSIYADKVVFSHEGSFLAGIVIEDSQFSNILKLLFDLALPEVKRIIENSTDVDTS